MSHDSVVFMCLQGANLLKNNSFSDGCSANHIDYFSATEIYTVLQALIRGTMRILQVNSQFYFLSDVVSGKVKKSSPILKKKKFDIC